MKKQSILTNLPMLLFLLFLMCSCATIVGGSKQPISIISTPSNAKISINNKYIGNTPFVHKFVRKEKETKIKIELDGYQPYNKTLHREFNSWFIGNLFFGGIIGIIIDAADGAMYKLTPEQISATLIVNSDIEEFGSLNDGNYIYVILVKKADTNWVKIDQLKK